MSLAISVFAEPAEEPLSLEEAKAQLRISNDEESALVKTYIKAARRYLERTRGRAFITQTLERQMDCFPRCGFFELPRPPLQSVTFIKYVDYGGNLVTLDPAYYQVDTKSRPGRVAPAYGLIFPPSRPQLGAVTVRYVCGEGAAAAVPEEVRQAMRLLVTDAFEFRSESVIGQVVSTRNAVDALLPVTETMWIGR